ncbi:MAG: tetratricopeptide repeat-containing sensor histidine kinase [Bacteroidia bacterium]
MKCLLTFLLIMSFSALVFPQDKRINTILSTLKKSNADTGKVREIAALFYLLSKGDITTKVSNYAYEALSISQKANYKWGKGISYYMISFSERSEGNYRQALIDDSTAEQILEQTGDKKNAGRCMFLRGHIFTDTGNYLGAIRCYNNALDTWEKIGDKELAAMCNNDLGSTYSFMGDRTNAVECIYKAMKISREIGDQKTLAKSLQFLGGIYDEFGDYDNAMSYLAEAASINRYLGDNVAFAQNNATIGELLLEKGNNTEALQKLYASLATYQKPGAPPWGETWVLEDIGDACQNQGDSAIAKGNQQLANEKYTDALNMYTAALQKAEEIKDPNFISDKKIALGKMYFKLGQIPVAKRYLLDALKTKQATQSIADLEPCYLYLSKIDSLQGNYNKAYQEYKSYIQCRDSTFSNSTSQKLSFYKTQTAVEKEEQQIKLLSAQNKLQRALSEKQEQEKKFMYTGVALLLLSGSYFSYRYIRRKQLQHQQQVLKERLRISRELHDEIGSTLSGIAMYSYITKEQMHSNKTEDVERSLNNIQQSANEMINKLSDIVWLVNPEKDSFSKLMERLEEFALSIARIKKMEVKINLESKLLDQNLPVDKRRNLYLFCKEAINNAIKYSNAKLIEVTMKEMDNKSIGFFINDNGEGFDSQNVRRGNGLTNMQKRAEEMNGQFSLQTTPGHGTSLSLIYKIT